MKCAKWPICIGWILRIFLAGAFQIGLILYGLFHTKATIPDSLPGSSKLFRARHIYLTGISSQKSIAKKRRSWWARGRVGMAYRIGSLLFRIRRTNQSITFSRKLILGPGGSTWMLLSRNSELARVNPLPMRRF